MVNKETDEWFLHGTSIQLQQRKALRHHFLASGLALLPSRKATIITSHLQLEASVDSFEFSVQSILHAELSFIDILGSHPTFG
jgi:hypothetical protein